MTQNYYTYESGNHRYVRLESYDFEWTRADSQVAWSGAFGRAGVAGYSPDNYYHRVETKQVGTPANKYRYVFFPSWSNVDIDVNGFGHWQAGNSEIRLKRGGTTWTLVHSNVVQGSAPGDF